MTKVRAQSPLDVTYCHGSGIPFPFRGNTVPDGLPDIVEAISLKIERNLIPQLQERAGGASTQRRIEAPVPTAHSEHGRNRALQPSSVRRKFFVTVGEYNPFLHEQVIRAPPGEQAFEPIQYRGE